MSNNADVAPQDDDIFVSLVQDVRLNPNDASLISSQIPKQVEILEAAKSQIKSGVTSQNPWDQVANSFQFFADAAKEEKSRSPIGESAVVSLIVSLEELNTQQLAHVDIQAMRAFANICVDHEANRQKVLEEHGFEIIVKVLKNANHPDAIKTACGALLNTTMGYEPAQIKVVELGAIEELLKVLKSDVDENETSMTIASRVIINLSESELGLQSIIKSDGIKTVVELLEKISEDADSYMDLMDVSTDILTAVISKDSAQVAMQKSGLFPAILSILENSEISDEGKTEDEKKEDDKKFGEIKASILEVAVSTTLSDENMEPIFNDKEVMSRFLLWLQLEEREDLQRCAAHCIGNVARSDLHCTRLVHEFHATEPLIHVVRKAKDLKAVHAASGLLQNLALPDKNKEILGDAGVIQACFPLLKKDNAVPLQANVVGIFKRLCRNSSNNTVRVISGREPFETLSSPSESEGEIETPLSTLVDLIRRTDEFPIKSEGTRILCSLIKTVWGNESMKGFGVASVTTLQQTLNKDDVVLQISAMTRNPKYVVLQNEGIIALTLLVTSPTQEKNAVLESLVSVATDPLPETNVQTLEEESSEQTPKTLTLLETLISLLKNQDGKCPDEIRANICVFLRNAINSASREGENPAYLTFLKSSGIKDTLEQVKNQEGTSQLIHTSIQEIISRLE
ncbi:hypothetical protein BGZ76_002258 [Entomortierella beljakovae]|nr:hypothetical protein BGZ76_002258 [Entomortierella beljakovae]